MTFWYVLIISFSAPFEGLSTVVPYPDSASCGRAILLIEPAVSEAIPLSAIQCKATAVPRTSLFPKHRPENLHANP